VYRVKGRLSIRFSAFESWERGPSRLEELFASSTGFSMFMVEERFDVKNIAF
jgi:hypothetical protein